MKKFFGPDFFDPLRDMKNQARGATDNCEDCGMPKRGGDNELMFADDEMCDCEYVREKLISENASAKDHSKPPKHFGDTNYDPKKDSKVDKAFEKAWSVVKAAPCPQCGAETGERCGKNQRNPANRCKLRRRSMESDRETTPSTWKE